MSRHKSEDNGRNKEVFELREMRMNNAKETTLNCYMGTEDA